MPVTSDLGRLRRPARNLQPLAVPPSPNLAPQDSDHLSLFASPGRATQWDPVTRGLAQVTSFRWSPVSRPRPRRAVGRNVTAAYGWGISCCSSVCSSMGTLAVSYFVALRKAAVSSLYGSFENTPWPVECGVWRPAVGKACQTW